MSSEFIKYGDAEKGVIDGTQKAITEVAALVAALAKTFAPVALLNGGALKGSIGYKTSDNETAIPTLSESVQKDQALVGSNIGYGLYQELGTRKMAAQPYLRPAVEIKAKGANAAKTIEKYMDEEITKAIMKGKKVFKV